MADEVLQVTILALTLLVLSFPSLQLDISKFDYSFPSEIVNSTGSRIGGARNRSNKDFVLGGLFPIHTAADGGGGCGAVRHERGLERMEAMLFAIDMINADDTILQGFTLGYDIRDTCSIENIGLDEAVDLVITNSQLDIESCRKESLSGSNITVLEGGFLEAPISGIVGAASSRVSVPVASLVRLFEVPQVSYASSSVLLSNRDRYDYFYRTIPPDDFQAQAMLDIMLHFNWSYVSTIFSRNTYGEPGINEFKTLAKKYDICIDLDEGIDDHFTIKKFRDLAERLIESEANIVILFTSQDNAASLFKQMVDIASSRRFTWIASDSWARSISVARNYNTTIAGLIGFVPFTEHVPSFHTYFSSLTLESNIRNPWFKEFYSAVKNCSLTETQGTTTCNRTRSLTDQEAYKQGNFIPLVINAVYTFAMALDNFLMENCEKPIQWFSNNRTCLNQMRMLNGSALLEYIKKVNFTSPTGDRIIFDDMGNVEGKYEILNYQAIDTSDDDGTRKREFVFNTVGIWESALTNESSLKSLQFSPVISFQFGLDSASGQVIISPPESQCGRCRYGQFRRPVKSSCCGLCDSCLGKFFSKSPLDFNCSLCEGFSWGNDPTNGSSSCEPLKQSFLSYSHPFSIIIMIITGTGFLFVIFTLVVFAKYWNTPIVKSSGREQMMTLLGGISLSFISAFFYISPPLTIICGIQRWLIWTSFATMFGALLVKTVRIARIFLKRRGTMRVRFTEPYYQLLFTLILVVLQWIIQAISFTTTVPKVEMAIRLVTEMPNKTPTVVVTCVSERIALLITSLSYETLLIILCTIFGILSFNYPANFNEAKYISLCTMSILVIWIAFVITFFATQNMQELQNIAISLAVVMSGYAVYLTIFGPKLFLLLFKPEKNNMKSSQPATITMDTQNTVDIPQGRATEDGWANPQLSKSTRAEKGESTCCLDFLP